MFLKVFTLIAIAGILTISQSCKHSHNHPDHQSQADSTGTQADRQTKEYGSAYVCPMHCKGSGSDKPGKCPVCKMDYVVNENAGNDHGHDHSDHEGHDHN